MRKVEPLMMLYCYLLPYYTIKNLYEDAQDYKK